MVIAPFWFSTEHLWIVIAPFWLSTDDNYVHRHVVISTTPCHTRPVTLNVHGVVKCHTALSSFTFPRQCSRKQNKYAKKQKSCLFKNAKRLNPDQIRVDFSKYEQNGVSFMTIGQRIMQLLNFEDSQIAYSQNIPQNIDMNMQISELMMS